MAAAILCSRAHDPGEDGGRDAIPFVAEGTSLDRDCPRCGHPETDHRTLPRQAKPVLRCRICHRSCRRL
jgi:hypothetical protein